MAHQRRDQLGRGQERVEVAPRSPGRERVVAGVDEVRADLERGDVRERGHDPGRDRRLAGAAAGAGDDDPRDHHSIPCCALMPCSMGCLILTTSLTRSAASISPGEASRPVTTMCWNPGRLDSVVTISSSEIQPYLIA